MKETQKFNSFLNEDADTKTIRVNGLHELTSELVSELMNAATSFHKLHLKVKDLGSFAAHGALKELYDAIPEMADTLAESYQGAAEKLLDYNEMPPRKLISVEDGLAYIRELKDNVNALQAVMPYSEIVNDLDLVKSALNTAKYKLIFLK
jgi:DNA-binding ferritin-like protein